MSAKKFLFLRLAVAMVIAATVSASITAGNYFIPIPVVVVGALLLYITKKRVKDVLEDERDFAIAGQAARYSIFIFAFMAVIMVFMLLAFKTQNPYFEIIASTLSYSVCSLLIFYSLVFKYLAVKNSSAKKRFVAGVAVFIIILVVLVIGLRLFSGEDDWLCQDGQWIKHGQPDWPAPTTECQ